MTIKSIAALGISAFALAVATPALAQDAPVAPRRDAGSHSAADDDASARWGFDPGRDRPVDRSGRRLLRLRQRQVAQGQSAAARIQPLRRVQPACREIDRRRQGAGRRAGRQGPGHAVRRRRSASSMPTTPISTPPRSTRPASPRRSRTSTQITRRRYPGRTGRRCGAAVGYPSPIGGGVTVDAKEPTRYSVYVGSGGLGLPDRDYYLDDSDRATRDPGQVPRLPRVPARQGRLRRCRRHGARRSTRSKTDRAHGRWDRATRRNRDLTYNALTPAELAALDPAFPIAALLDAHRLRRDRPLHRRRPAAERRGSRDSKLGPRRAYAAKIGGGTPAMMELLARPRSTMLQAWTVKSFLDGQRRGAAERRSTRRSFDFYGKLLNGTPEQRAALEARDRREPKACSASCVGAALCRALLPAAEQGGDGRSGRQPAQGAGASASARTPG